MTSNKNETHEPLRPDDIIPGDPVTTLWRWCAKNNWTFVIDFEGGEPFVDTRCAAAYCAPSIGYKSALNSLLNGVQRYPGGTVRISEVMRLREA